MLLRLVVFSFFIFLVGCSSRHTPAPVVDVQAKVPLSKRVKNKISATEYIVRKGETLYSIAWRADIDVRTIASLNKITAPYQIFPGQKIFLVKKTPQARKDNTSNKSSRKEQQTIVKKPVAPNKKQEYGGIVGGEKVSKKPLSKPKAFSQKIDKWIWPTSGKVIAKFSTKKQGNKGIDIAGSRNSSVKAAADGKVVYAGDVLRGYGQLVIVKHNDDYLSAYAHNDHILVKEQQAVKAGQVIARMGDTGAKRVMLHFEVRFRGKSVNPLKYLPRR